MTGVYDAYAAIIGRLQAECPGFALIDSPSAVASEDDVLRKLPGCYVFPGESKPTDNGNMHELNLEDQDWLVMVVVGYPGAGSAEPETTLGTLTLSVIDALHDWPPTGSEGRLRYQGRKPVEYNEGYALIRLQFNRRQVINRN